MQHYSSEKEGQIDFYKKIYKDEKVTYENYTDGVIDGVIFEFKLSISNINSVLFQTIKYLSRMRVEGKSIPATICLLSLNEEISYFFNSQDFLSEIETIYTGPSSKNNEKFNVVTKPIKIDFGKNIGYLVKLINESKNFIKIHINEDCVVGWAERFYKIRKNAIKGEFFSEIRNPKMFENFIFPYKEKTNKRFQYLMDCLNDPLHKKELGAFYTPLPYCRKATELVRSAIKRVPKGNDYVIIDRCAGTGNLESSLTSDELTHVIVSTYEYFEYKVLCERFAGNKVRFIIPPTVSEEDFVAGHVPKADALGYEVLDQIKPYVEDKKVTIILFENPPYSEAGAKSTVDLRDDENKSAPWKSSLVCKKMKEDIKGKSTNELANLFIWSAFKYYLRLPSDSYILFSPVKYFKSQNLVNRTFMEGFIFNKTYFHAKGTPSAISCIWWMQPEIEQDKFDAPAFDIENWNVSQNDGVIVNVKRNIHIKKVHRNISQLYEIRKSNTNDEKGIVCNTSGYENVKGKLKIKPLYNQEIIGYLISQSFGFENPRLACNLTRCAMFNGNGFYLTGTNYFEKLPLFAVGKYPSERKWWEHGIVMKCSDNGNGYLKDLLFLKSCFIFTCLSYFNKCLSFTGTDNRFYKNELCFDGDTVANKKLNTLRPKLTVDEEILVKQFNEVLKESKHCNGYPRIGAGIYNKKYVYGVYQISQELNTSYKDVDTDKIYYDYPELNTKLSILRTLVLDYYDKFIAPKLFEHGLLK